MSISSPQLLKHFPYPKPREIQIQTLEALSENWNKYDCFVIVAPTAFGKTALARTLMNAFHSVSAITPTNLLVDQFLDEFPDTPTLSRLDSYWCEKWRRPCPITRGKTRNFCNMTRDNCACPASADLSTAKYRRGPGIYNYHTFLAHKLYRDVLVVDEAHNLLPQIRERQAIRIWQHDVRYPHNMWTHEQIREWISSLPPNKQKNKKIQLLKEAVTYDVPTYIAQRTTEEFNGKGTIRGEPEERDLLKLLPVDISDAPPMFWPRDVQKIVLLSATIGAKDIEALGLNRKRVCYIDCKSPIPAENRPIIPLGIISVNRSNMNHAADLIAAEIEQIANFHSGQKGIIHATYQMSNLLRSRLQGSRFLYHDRETKREVYNVFRNSEPSEGKVLIACGLYEGVDLPDDLGRWQVITKIPWMSLGNPAIKHLSELDPEWYEWETLKTTIQAAGRICRHPEDFGVTYILDSSFNKLTQSRVEIPQWFLDAIR
jgi:ATP-dependent DNA helicase DinG